MSSVNGMPIIRSICRVSGGSPFQGQSPPNHLHSRAMTQAIENGTWPRGAALNLQLARPKFRSPVMYRIIDVLADNIYNAGHAYQTASNVLTPEEASPSFR
jgi:hypothetical protein